LTLEHKFVTGLDDIKSVSLECMKCRTRLTASPDNFNIPTQCPQCGQIWHLGDIARYSGAVASPYVNFLTSLGKIRTLLENDASFRILLEFDEEQD
jgi:hypothetical protein